MRVWVARTCDNSLSCSGSRWTTTTKAAPARSGSASKNICSARIPPAEAPIATMVGHGLPESSDPGSLSTSLITGIPHGPDILGDFQDEVLLPRAKGETGRLAPNLQAVAAATQPEPF